MKNWKICKFWPLWSPKRGSLIRKWKKSKKKISLILTTICYLAWELELSATKTGPPQGLLKNPIFRKQKSSMITKRSHLTQINNILISPTPFMLFWSTQEVPMGATTSPIYPTAQIGSNSMTQQCPRSANPKSESMESTQTQIMEQTLISCFTETSGRSKIFRISKSLSSFLKKWKYSKKKLKKSKRL